MSSDTSRAVRVGALALAALAIFAFLVWRLSSGIGLFASRAVYFTQFPTTRGLSVGAEVRLRGVTVGSVESIEFSDDPRIDEIVVRLAVRRSVSARIDRHVVAELRSKGPLGDRLLELVRDDLPYGTPLEERSLIPSKPPFDMNAMVDVGSDVFTDIRSISESLSVITQRLVAGEGLFGRLLEDKEFGENTLTDLEASMKGLRELVDTSARGENLLGKLVADEAFATKVVGDLESAIRSLEAITSRIAAGKGPVGQLFDDDSTLNKAVEDFAVAAASLRGLTDAFEKADGSIARRLLLDEDFGSAVAADLAESARHARNVTRKLDEGVGSAGLFLNDGGLYEGVNDIVRGIEASWFINHVLKRKQKKGFRERVDRILAESEDPDAELLALMKEVLASADAERADESSTVEEAP